MKDNRSERRGYRLVISLESYVLAAGTDSLRCNHRARRVPDRHAPSPRAPAIVAADAGEARAEAHAYGLADSNPPVQGRIGDRGLETRYQWPLRFAQDLSDLPLVG